MWNKLTGVACHPDWLRVTEQLGWEAFHVVIDLFNTPGKPAVCHANVLRPTEPHSLTSM